MRRRSILVSALALTALSAAPAGAASPRLLDGVPTPAKAGTTGDSLTPVLTFRDRVIPQSPRPRALLRSGARAYKTADGTKINVTLSSAYAGNTKLAQSYVTYLGSLPHGSELGKLKVFIAPASEVSSTCGGGADVLACYLLGPREMVVPGDPTSMAGGVSTAFVVAHEYGHHIAQYRKNDPFKTIDFGPKYWASDEYVCLGVINDAFYPGDEDAHYASNPGEAFAESYAHLTYPNVEFDYDSRLAPTAASLAAIRRDVRHPWTGPVRKAYRGTSSRTIHLRQRLDGRIKLALAKTRRSAHYAVHITVGTASRSVTPPQSYVSCRAHSSEAVTITVKRTRGTGRFKLTVSYPG